MIGRIFYLRSEGRGLRVIEEWVKDFTSKQNTQIAHQSTSQTFAIPQPLPSL
jgi:hypothetical protein